MTKESLLLIFLDFGERNYDLKMKMLKEIVIDIDQNGMRKIYSDCYYY